MFKNDFFILYLATALFAGAILHTFFTSKILHLARIYKKHLFLSQTLHLLGEVEVVFGFWAFLFLIIMSLSRSVPSTILYLNELRFQEPVFVFMIMCMASTKPILNFFSFSLKFLAGLVPFKKTIVLYFTILTIGPLLGSLITEPAAMTITAMLLKAEFFNKKMSVKFCYFTLALLFVNISLGGALTHFAAPPILMVAKTWNWNTPHVFFLIGWKAAIIVIINTLMATIAIKSELNKVHATDIKLNLQSPIWLILSHIFFLFLIVSFHHSIIFMCALFLIFMAWHTITRHLQSELNIRETLLVGTFLAGLIVLGGLQAWWMSSVINYFENGALFLASTILTAFTDNAAVTFLGASVPNISLSSQYALVTGALVGGGLTVIANAPNPAGISILNSSFGDEGVSFVGLFLSALPFTLFGMAIFYFL